MSDHDEQETLATLKDWWTRWGGKLVWAILVVLVVVVGWNGWQYWQRQQTAKAAILYDEVRLVTALGDRAKILRVITDMEQRYPRTAYAQMSALLAAQAFAKLPDMAAAKAQLEWTIKHGQDAGYQQIARLRLATLLLQEKSYDAGLKLLDKPPSAAFSALYADRRGDLLVAQGKPSEARAAFQSAFSTLQADSPLRRLIQVKLEALGG